MNDLRPAQRPVSGRDIALFATVALITALITRLPVLPLTVIDWDESVYFLISRDVLHGILPYQGGFDHKPVALYYVFALPQLIFGHNMVAIRLLAIFSVACAAFLVAFHLRRSTGATRFVAAASAVLYAVLSTLNGGLATNTEVILNAYAALAMLLLASRRIILGTAPAAALAAGIAFGLMIHTNYLSAPVAVGLCLGYAVCVWTFLRPVEGLLVCIKNGLLVLLGLVLVTGAVWLPVAVWSDLGGYLSEQSTYLTSYRDPATLMLFLGGVFPALLGYSFAVALAITALILFPFKGYRKQFLNSPDRVVGQQAALYLVFAGLTGLLSGRFFPHYFILMLPPFCVCFGLFLAQFPQEGALQRFCAIWLIVLAAFSQITIRQWYGYGIHGWQAWLAGQPPDVPSKIAADIKPALMPGDRIYIYDYQPIVYALLGVPLPGKYFFPPHHLTDRYGLNPETAMARFLAAAPRFIIAGRSPDDTIYGAASRMLAAALAKNYRLVGRYSSHWRTDIRVYERK